MRTVQWRESYRWTMAVIKRHDFTWMLGNITDYERWCTQAWRTKADLRFDGLRRRHRMSDGVGPCGIEHVIENSGADDGFAASRRIAAGSHAIADEGLVAAHRGLDQRTFAVSGDLLPAESAQLGDRQQVGVARRRVGLEAGTQHSVLLRRNHDRNRGVVSGDRLISGLAVVGAVGRACSMDGSICSSSGPTWDSSLIS